MTKEAVVRTDWRQGLCAGVAAAAMLAGPAPGQARGHTVTVDVAGARSEAGSVRAVLCDNAAIFCATHQAAAAASTDGMQLVFTGVEPGRYALAAFHDENDDGQAQIPPEGYAYGNGAGYPPTFEAASILVEGDTRTALSMVYIDGVAAMGVARGSAGAPAPDGVSKADVRENGLYGAYYRPEGEAPVPAIILLGGSEGGIDTISSMAPSFALAGYGVLALAYWGEVGLPQTLENIPLEYFDDAVDWLAARPDVDGEAIGVMGWSRGSEAALLLGARNPAIKAVGAIAPSGVVWSGIDFSDFVNVEAAWTADGQALPYMTTDASAYVPNGPMAPLYENVLPEADARPETAIAVERINGPVLLISGGDDALWPSVTFAERIAARLEAADFPHAVENLVYPEAGHVVFVGAPDGMMARGTGAMQNPMMGGSAEANAAAWADNWPRTLAFFDAALKEGGQ